MKIVMSMIIATLFVFSVAAASGSEILNPDAQGRWKQWGNVGCAKGSGEWQCVNGYNIATYLKNGGNNRKETFSFEDPTFSSSEPITSVLVQYVARYHNNVGNSCFAAMTRASGVDYQSGAQLCSGAGWSLYSHTYATNPATGLAWTYAEVTNIEAGMYSLDPNGGSRIAQVQVVVNYGDNSSNSTNETAPDLVIEDITFTEFFNSSTNTTQVSIVTEIKNIGDAIAGASSVLINDTLGYSQPHAIGSLAPGASAYAAYTRECSAAFTVIADADHFDDVAESDETNNVGTEFIDCVL